MGVLDRRMWSIPMGEAPIRKKPTNSLVLRSPFCSFCENGALSGSGLVRVRVEVSKSKVCHVRANGSVGSAS
jgi:hypothetical protein